MIEHFSEISLNNILFLFQSLPASFPQLEKSEDKGAGPDSGPVPRGGIPGPCPPQMTACTPQTKIVPPQERSVPQR